MLPRAWSLCQTMLPILSCNTTVQSHIPCARKTTQRSVCTVDKRPLCDTKGPDTHAIRVLQGL